MIMNKIDEISSHIDNNFIDINKVVTIKIKNDNCNFINNSSDYVNTYLFNSSNPHIGSHLL
jgi:hypothetical protein